MKILVFLTMPIEPSSNDIPLQIEYLWGLKSSITHSNTVAVVVSLLEGPLENLEWLVEILFIDFITVPFIFIFL